MLHVLFGRTHHLPRDEALGVFEQVEIAARIFHKVGRHLLHRAALAIEEHWQVRVARQVIFQQILDLAELFLGILMRVDGDQDC
ncbi:hypothetical protein D3C72_1305000 [compost metagenome]